MNPFTEVFNVPDGTGLSLSDYQLVFSGAGFWSSPGAWLCGTFLAGAIYFLVLAVFAPITWVMDFVTNPDGIASILANIGLNLSETAFKLFPPLALGTIALMILVVRLTVMPRMSKEWGGAGGNSTQSRLMGKTGFNYDSTIARGHWKNDANRSKAVDQIAAGFILLIVIVVFTSRPFMILQKILEFARDIVASITSEQGGVASPMFGVLRGITWIINFGGAIPESCVQPWSESMQSGEPDAIKECLPAEQASNMTPTPQTFILAGIALLVVYALFKFAWPFLKNATWFLAVVVWKCIYIPYIALRTLIQPFRPESRGILDDMMTIFRVILTYTAYYLGIVFLAALLPSAIMSTLSEMGAHPVIQIAVTAVAYYLLGKYVIANIRPGGELFGTTMLGTSVGYDGWGQWREKYWEDPSNRPTQIFQKIGADGVVLSPGWSKERRKKKAAKAAAEAAAEPQKVGGDPVLSAADKKVVDRATEKITVNKTTNTGKPTDVVFGNGTSEPSTAAGRPAAKPIDPATLTATAAAIAAATAGAPDHEPTPRTAHAANDPVAAATSAAATNGRAVADPVPTVSRDRSVLPSIQGRPETADRVRAAAPAADPLRSAEPGPTTPNWHPYRTPGFGSSWSDTPHHSPGQSGREQYADEIIILGQSVRFNPSLLFPSETSTHEGSIVDGEVIATENETTSHPAALPAPSPRGTLEERQQALLRNLQSAMAGTPQQNVDLTDSTPQSQRGRHSSEKAVSPNTSTGGTDTMRSAEHADDARYPNRLGFDPVDEFGTAATVTDTTTPVQSVTAGAAAERAHLEALHRAEARGEAILPRLSRAMEEQEAMFFDPREPGGVAFDRKMGFNDRI